MTAPINCQTVWRTHPVTTAFHAGAALDAGHPLVNQQLQAALEPPLGKLREFLQSRQLDSTTFWQNVIAQSVELQSMASLARFVVRKMIGSRGESSRTLDQLTGHLSALQRAAQPLCGDLQRELETRLGPLRAQWEARGPGFLFRVVTLSDRSLVVPKVDVLVTLPVLGGAGDALLDYNSVSIEGVLANPDPKLPEVVRLGWLISQLNNDLPRFSENINRRRLPLIAKLAMLPPALAAAEHVELTTNHPGLWGAAIRGWRIGDDAQATAMGETTREWWATYQAARPGWDVALTALDRMIQF